MKAKVAHLTEDVGNAGQERLMLMAALIIADELWDARAEIEALTLSASHQSSAEPEPVRRLKTLAAKLGAHAKVDDVEASAADPTHGAVKPRRRDVA